MSDLADVLQKVLGGLSQLPTVLGNLAGVLARLSSGMGPLLSAINSLNTSNKGGGGGSPGAGIPLPPGAKGAGGALGSVAAVAGPLAIAAGAAIAFSVALDAATDQFHKIVEYVRLFNPAIVNRLNIAIDDAGATLGRAFVPVVQMATDLVRQGVTSLAAVMGELIPLVRELTTSLGEVISRVLISMGSVLKSVIDTFSAFRDVIVIVVEAISYIGQVFGGLLRALLLVMRVLYEITGMGTIVRDLVGLFEILAEAMRIFDAAITIVEIVFTTIGQALAGLFGTLESPMKKLKEVVDYTIRGMFVLSAVLAKFAGMDSLVDNLIAYAEGQTKKGDKAAQTPAMKTIEQIAKDMAMAAAVAMGNAGSSAMTQEKFWAETVKELQFVKNNGASVKEILQEILDEIVAYFKGTPSEDAVGNVGPYLKMAGLMSGNPAAAGANSSSIFGANMMKGT